MLAENGIRPSCLTCLCRAFESLGSSMFPTWDCIPSGESVWSRMFPFTSSEWDRAPPP